MMTESQARIIKDAFEYGVTTVFESACKKHVLIGYNKKSGHGALIIHNVFGTGEKFSYPISLVKLENHQLVLVLDDGEMTFTFFYEVGA